MRQPMGSSGDWDEVDGVPVLETSGADTFAFVDGDTGVVLTGFFLDELPGTANATISADAAESAAAAWLAGAGISTEDMTAAVESRTAADISYFAASWTASGGSDASFEILVNAADGQVFAYGDLRSVTIPVPLIGWDAALRLAEASPLSHGEMASPGGKDNLMWDGALWSWQVGFNDGALSVDAATGEVTSLKWAE